MMFGVGVHHHHNGSTCFSERLRKSSFFFLFTEPWEHLMGFIPESPFSEAHCLWHVVELAIVPGQPSPAAHRGYRGRRAAPRRSGYTSFHPEPRPQRPGAACPPYLAVPPMRASWPCPPLRPWWRGVVAQSPQSFLAPRHPHLALCRPVGFCGSRWKSACHRHWRRLDNVKCWRGDHRRRTHQVPIRTSGPRFPRRRRRGVFCGIRARIVDFVLLNSVDLPRLSGWLIMCGDCGSTREPDSTCHSLALLSIVSIEVPEQATGESNRTSAQL